jgi:hypothetical protein
MPAALAARFHVSHERSFYTHAGKDGNMIRNTIRELKRLGNTTQLSVTVELDDDRYYDRQCPREECAENFKVHFDDWKDIVADERVFCPACRSEAPSTEWSTPHQGASLRRQAMAHIHTNLGRAMSADARSSTHRPSFGPVKITMAYRPGFQPLLVPAAAAAILQQRYVCEACQCRYASRGSAYFCPACGHNSVLTTFNDTVEAVRRTVSALAAVVVAIEDLDTARDFERHALESSLVKLVGAFQRVSEAMFGKLANAGNVKRGKNAFQSLSLSSALWKQETGKGYEDLVSPDVLERLSRVFQQRHLLAHREGIVDQEYIDKTSDTTYAVGQRLVIREDIVLSTANAIQALGNALRRLA